MKLSVIVVALGLMATGCTSTARYQYSLEASNARMVARNAAHCHDEQQVITVGGFKSQTVTHPNGACHTVDANF